MLTENYLLIRYKWDHGIYKIEDIIKAVEQGKITKQDFLQITSYNYDGFNKNKNKIKQEET